MDKIVVRKLRKSLINGFKGVQGFSSNVFDRKKKIPRTSVEIDIGKSVKGENIVAYKFGDNKNRRILFLGGIHGNEVGTVKLMHRLIDHLNRGFENLASELYIIPCLNPDGYEIALKKPDYFGGGRFGRFNANSVDLNRNFETKNFSSQNNWYFDGKNIPVYCGEKAFSEPESKCLAEFVKDKNISIIYSFHNRGQEVMGGKDALSQKLTKNFIEKTGYKYVSEEDWKSMKQTGTLKESCEDNGIAYIEVESKTRYGSDWKNQKNAIIGALNNFHG